jgi:hypothetical protein
MTAFEGILTIMLTIGVTIAFLALSSLSQAALRYAAAYERVVDAACKPAVSQTGNGETLAPGVYHATPDDINEYMKNRKAQNVTALKRPQGWKYDDDEYDGFPAGVYKEERRL